MLRNHLNYSQERMAGFFGVCRRSYQLWEDEVGPPHPSAIVLIHRLIRQISRSGKGFRAVPKVRIGPKLSKQYRRKNHRSDSKMATDFENQV